MAANGRPAWVGINTDVVLGILVSALLGWVGITTYLSALEMRGMSATLEFFMAERKSEDKELRALFAENNQRMADERRRIEARIDSIDPRLRAMEKEHAGIIAGAGP